MLIFQERVVFLLGEIRSAEKAVFDPRFGGDVSCGFVWRLVHQGMLYSGPVVAVEDLALVTQRWKAELVVRLTEADPVVDLPMRPFQPRRCLMAVLLEKV